MIPEPPVRFGRLKILGSFLIGAMIVAQGLPDAELRGMRLPIWGRSALTIALGGFYAVERYLSRSPTWYKPDVERIESR